MDYTEVVKNQYFSQENLEFIISVVKSKTDKLISNESVFKIRNNIFNSFIHTVYSQKKKINPESIEDLLITLNKMTIENIIKESSHTTIYQPQQSIQQQSIQQQSIHQQPLQQQSIQQQSIQQQPLQQQSIQQQPLQQQSIQQQSIQQQPLSQTQENQENQETLYQEILHMKDKDIQTDIYIKNRESLYIFLNDYPFENEEYKLEFRRKNMQILKLKRLELFNNLYNINEFNNKMEFVENNTKKNICIPVGCYTLEILLNVLEKQLNEKFNHSNYKITYNTNKNRISISNEKQFGFTFIETDSVIPLRFILGFSNKQYVNNTNYTSDLNPIIDIYDNLYLKFSSSQYSILNNKYTKDMCFFQHIKLNHLETFGQTIRIDINDEMQPNDIDDINLEIYYRHIHHNKFYKVKVPISIVLIFEIEF